QSKLVKYFSRQLSCKRKVALQERNAKLEGFPQLLHWFRIVDIRKEVMEEIAPGQLSLEELLEMTDEQVCATVEKFGANSEECARLNASLSCLRSVHKSGGSLSKQDWTIQWPTPETGKENNPVCQPEAGPWLRTHVAPSPKAPAKCAQHSCHAERLAVEGLPCAEPGHRSLPPSPRQRHALHTPPRTPNIVTTMTPPGTPPARRRNKLKPPGTPPPASRKLIHLLPGFTALHRSKSHEFQLGHRVDEAHTPNKRGKQPCRSPRPAGSPRVAGAGTGLPLLLQREGDGAQRCCKGWVLVRAHARAKVGERPASWSLPGHPSSLRLFAQGSLASSQLHPGAGQAWEAGSTWSVQGLVRGAARAPRSGAAWTPGPAGAAAAGHSSGPRRVLGQQRPWRRVAARMAAGPASAAAPAPAEAAAAQHKAPALRLRAARGLSQPFCCTSRPRAPASCAPRQPPRRGPFREQGLSGDHPVAFGRHPSGCSALLVSLQNEEGNEEAQESEDDFEEMNLSLLSARNFPRKASQTSIFLQEWDIPFEQLEIGELIGKGRFGQVFHGRWHGEVAIRLIDIERDNEDQLKAFKREVMAYRQTRHENVVLFMGACMSPPHLAIITSLCKGRTLYSVVRDAKMVLDVNKTRQIAQEIVKGMGYLHAKGILHKDLKSKNVFYDNGKVVITDFGLFSISGVLQAGRRENKLRIQNGWLCHLAPEIIRQLSPDTEEDKLPFSKHSDVFALGTIWYELHAREWPFKTQPAEAIIWQVGRGMKPNLSQIGMGKEISDILLFCWAYEQEERPSFTKLMDMLEKLPKRNRRLSHPGHFWKSAE
ncbi:KSR2 Kinase, partial [Nothoprocta ornata]|nr:KSR2 Kinase [Nothoprocta ornata]